MGALSLPEPARGRPNAAVRARMDRELRTFAAAIKEINSTLDFKVSSRGWCYLLEEHGLAKGDFDRAQRLINDCRKSGLLPLDICADDAARAAEHLDLAGADAHASIEDAIETELAAVESAQHDALTAAGWGYRPHDFWYDQDCYVEMLVEKIDLRSLFEPVCRDFCVPLANSKGWPDLNSRAAMMRRFATMEARDKRCVLLYCGDHDPAGLRISGNLREMLEELAGAVGWRPDNLVIDRFGLTAEFIATAGLSWIDNLETGSGRSLADPRHPDHSKPYVQEYLTRYGARKCEANALVTRPGEGRALCRAAIGRYVDLDAPQRYETTCRAAQQTIRAEVNARWGAV